MRYVRSFSSVSKKSYTACGHSMAHRKWKETKLHPSMLPGLSLFPFPVGHPMSACCNENPLAQEISLFTKNIFYSSSRCEGGRVVWTYFVPLTSFWPKVRASQWAFRPTVVQLLHNKETSYFWVPASLLREGRSCMSLNWRWLAIMGSIST